MSEWQPIETAPKNGESVLLYDPVYKHHIGSWMSDIEHRRLDFETGERTCYIEKAHWSCWSNRLNKEFEPTHWMPLPDPPAR